MGYAIIDNNGRVLETSKAPIIKRITWGTRISFRSDRPIETRGDYGPFLHCSKGNSKGKAIKSSTVCGEKGLLYHYSIEVVGYVSKDVEEIIEKLEHRLGALDI